MTARPGTTNSEAELAYQRGMHHFNRYNYQHDRADFDQAMEAYQKALDLDSRMADAAAGIAWLHEFAIEAGSPVDTMLPEVRRWAQRAVSIDDRCSRAWAVLAFAELISTPPRPRDALVFGLRAATHDPRDAFAANGVGIGLMGGSSTLAFAAMQQAARIDPLYLYPPLNNSELLVYMGKITRPWPRRTPCCDWSQTCQTGLRKALTLMDLGRSGEASALVPRCRNSPREDGPTPSCCAHQGWCRVAQGDEAAKRAALDRLERQAKNPGTFAEYPRVYVWLVRHGRTAEALRAMEQRARAGRVPYDFLHRTPDFKALAKNEHYVRALAISRAQFEETVSVLKEAEARGEMPPYVRQPLADLLNKLGMSGGRRTATSQGALHGHQPLEVRRGVIFVFDPPLNSSNAAVRPPGWQGRASRNRESAPCSRRAVLCLPRLDLPLHERQVRYVVFFVIRLKTRTVEIAGITRQPHELWMTQMVRNLTDPHDGFLRDAQDEGPRPRPALHRRLPDPAAGQWCDSRAPTVVRRQKLGVACRGSWSTELVHQHTVGDHRSDASN